jgi:ABC-type uncharacterized transport system involved in gliding motility auxiliary subunit
MKAKTTNQIIGNYLLRIGIILMVMLISTQLYLRLDLSANKSFSLGKYSRETVAGLKDKMVIKVYASKDLPPEFNNVQRYMQDLMVEYKRASKGKLNYEFVRYKDAEELASLAEENHLQTFPVQIYEDESLVMKDVILGLVFESQGRFDILNLYPGLEPTMEYEITKTIQNVDGKLLPYLHVFQDTLYKYYPAQLFNREINQNYKVGLTDLEKPLAQIQTLLFAGITHDLSLEQLYNLDQFIMKGGKVVFLQDRIHTDQYGINAMESNIFALLAHYGVLIEPNMVLDSRCSEGQGRGLGEYIPYPIFPVVRGMDDSPITRNTDNTLLYFASEITALDSINIEFEPILQTSASSGILRGPVFNIEPVMTRGLSYPLNDPPVTVAAKVSGKLTSFFARDPAMQKPGFVAERKDAEFIVFGDSELFMDPDDPLYLNRGFVVLNAIDYFMDNLSMIQIRTRNLAPSVLRMDYYMYKKQIQPAELERYRSTSRALLGIFKSIAIFLPVLLLAILGFFVWLAKKPKEAEA